MKGINKNKSSLQNGFFIKLIGTSLLNNLKILVLGNIVDDINNSKDDFIYNLYNLFEIEINYCKIKNYYFDIQDEPIIKYNEIYFEIFTNKIEINIREKKIKEIFFPYKILKIENMLNNNIYNFINGLSNEYNKTISCCCLVF